MAAPEPEIVLPGRSSSPTPAITAPHGGPGPVVCALCLSAPGKYTCPRCNAPYCSLACYRGARHSACSELFYRDAVLRTLREEDAERRGRRQVEETLLKLREEEAPLCGTDAVISEEESGLWDSLSCQEKEHFNQLLQSGHIGSLVPEWRPWWENQQGYKIMELPEAAQCQGAALPTCQHHTDSRDTQCQGAAPPTCQHHTDSRNTPTCQHHTDSRDTPTCQHHTDSRDTQCQGAALPTCQHHTDSRDTQCQGAAPPACQHHTDSRDTQCQGAAPPTCQHHTDSRDTQCQGAAPPACQHRTNSRNTPTCQHHTDSKDTQCQGAAPPTCQHHTGSKDTQCQGAAPPTCQHHTDRQHMPSQGAAPPTCQHHTGSRHTPSQTREAASPEKRGGVSAQHGHHQSNTDIKPKKEETLQRDPGLDDLVSELPPLLGSIPPLSSLTRHPSPLVRFTLVNVIYSYAFSLLRHNGDLSDPDILADFVGTLLSVSGALSTTIVYNSTAHALKSAVRAASDPLLGGDEGGAILAMEATAKILLGNGGKRFSLAALSHLYQLLGKARKLVAAEKEVRKGAFNAKKKCLFLASWVNENEGSLSVLSAEVMVEYKGYLKDLNEVDEISKGLQRVWGGKRPPPKKTLIQEVD
ncbi:zinc finger HIT domain-containing protein 2 [Dendropsophus ebraccatus]|uniref:zinc finger HIT domain-containing protein 2 n=1 Tax=Dendropsophus ebraccatus TaxID=150705 RepID=UPI003831505A